MTDYSKHTRRQLLDRIYELEAERLARQRIIGDQCIWTLDARSDGYTCTYSTSCGVTFHHELPLDVGFSLPPYAEELGPKCSNCGKSIRDSRR